MLVRIIKNNISFIGHETILSCFRFVLEFYHVVSSSFIKNTFGRSFWDKSATVVKYCSLSVCTPTSNSSIFATRLPTSPKLLNSPKGYFPHLFNTDYIGPLPVEEFSMLESTFVKDRDAFRLDQMTQAGHIFDLCQELELLLL